MQLGKDCRRRRTAAEVSIDPLIHHMLPLLRYMRSHDEYASNMPSPCIRLIDHSLTNINNMYGYVKEAVMSGHIDYMRATINKQGKAVSFSLLMHHMHFSPKV